MLKDLPFVSNWVRIKKHKLAADDRTDKNVSFSEFYRWRWIPSFATRNTTLAASMPRAELLKKLRLAPIAKTLKPIFAIESKAIQSHKEILPESHPTGSVCYSCFSLTVMVQASVDHSCSRLCRRTRPTNWSVCVIWNLNWESPFSLLLAKKERTFGDFSRLYLPTFQKPKSLPAFQNLTSILMLQVKHFDGEKVRPVRDSKELSIGDRLLIPLRLVQEKGSKKQTMPRVRPII